MFSALFGGISHFVSSVTIFPLFFWKTRVKYTQNFTRFSVVGHLFSQIFRCYWNIKCFCFRLSLLSFHKWHRIGCSSHFFNTYIWLFMCVALYYGFFLLSIYLFTTFRAQVKSILKCQTNIERREKHRPPLSHIETDLLRGEGRVWRRENESEMVTGTQGHSGKQKMRERKRE